MNHHAMRVFVLLFVIVAGIADGLRASGQDDAPLRILVVNDDGIDSQAMQALARELAALGEVVVCAPAGNRSGSSQSLSVLSTPLVVEERVVEGVAAAYAVSGTPADAADFGVHHLGAERPFDLVVSGINTGANVGGAAHLSGTVGAAMHSAMCGVPAIAVSLGGRVLTVDFAARFTREFIVHLKEQSGLTTDVVYSINLPSADPARINGVVVCPMGETTFKILGYQRVETADGVVQYRAQAARGDAPAEGTDTDLFAKGMITITPLKLDLTAERSVDRMKDVDLSSLLESAVK